MVPAKRATAPTNHIVPFVFAFLRATGSPIDKATIVRHIAPLVNGMGYRPRKMGGVSYAYEAYWGLRTLRHSSLVLQTEDDRWCLTELGRTRPIEITPDEANGIVKRGA